MKHAKWLLPLLCSLFLAEITGCGRPEAANQNEPEQQGQTPGKSKTKKNADRSGKPGDSLAGKKDRTEEDEIFAKPRVLRIEIEIPRAGMSLLRRTSWGGGGGEERPVAKATVREGGVVYNNVAVHLKGAAGSFRPVDDRPALTLNFDKFVPGQSLHGLHKISLNNSEQDPSFLSEKICREMFDAAGVPVPRAGYAMVKFNGRDMGLYVMLEGANKQFLKRYFHNTKGNLFDGGFCKDVDEPLSVNSGDNPKDLSGLQALGTAEAESRRKGLAPLEKALDVDRFISMLVMEVMVWHWDGYGLNKNNWRIFHDLDSNRMVFIPHGMDQTFGISNRGPVDPIPRNWTGKVAREVMRTEEGRRRYQERFVQLYTNVFKIDQILARIDEIETAIVPIMAEWDPHAARNEEAQANQFKQMVIRRNREMGRKLEVPLPPANTVKFGSDGILPVKGWAISTVRLGEPKLSQSQDTDGKPCLLIQASGEGVTSGSWRARMNIGPGRYRFQGRVRVEGLTAEPGNNRAGADLRISKGAQPPKLTGTTDWKDFAYDFEVEEELTEVELICELARATQGVALFDLGSLRLVRLP